jgi:azurin
MYRHLEVRRNLSMKTTTRMLKFVAVLMLSFVIAACGGGGTTAGGNAGGGAASGGGAATLEIGSAGENLAFEPATLTASAGQQVTVNFKNNSAVQQHNWVLVNGGEDVAKPIADGGLTAGADADYLPADQANVIAHTEVLDGNESGSVSFTAPAAGTYLFICTVPGHYPLMQGTLTVN